MIDEAEKLGDNPILGKIAAEGRKYGMGIIATSQRAKVIDKDLRNNAAVFISFYQREPEELNYVANFISGGNELGRFVEVKKGIRNLGRGYAVVVDSLTKAPIIVHFDRHIGENLNIKFSILQLSKRGIGREELKEALEKVCDISELQNPLSALLESGELKQYDITKGRYSGKWYISNQRNSAEHDICVSIISRHLSSLNIHNRIYNTAYGPDVIAFYNKRRVALEYETGLKNINETRTMVEKRMKYYPKVLIITNDESYLEYSKTFGNVIKFSEIDRIGEAIAS